MNEDKNDHYETGYLEKTLESGGIGKDRRRHG